MVALPFKSILRNHFGVLYLFFDVSLFNVPVVLQQIRELRLKSIVDLKQGTSIFNHLVDKSPTIELLLPLAYPRHTLIAFTPPVTAPETENSTRHGQIFPKAEPTLTKAIENLF